VRLRDFDRTPTQNDVISPVRTFDEDGVRFTTMRKGGSLFSLMILILAIDA
jgi:hypothetical protein